MEVNIVQIIIIHLKSRNLKNKMSIYYTHTVHKSNIFCL